MGKEQALCSWQGNNLLVNLLPGHFETRELFIPIPLYYRKEIYLCAPFMCVQISNVLLCMFSDEAKLQASFTSPETPTIISGVYT